MFKSSELEKIYNCALQKDTSNFIKHFRFLFDEVENPSPDTLELLSLLTEMYTDLISASRQVTELIRSLLSYQIVNIQEMIQILKPYQQLMKEKKQLGQPLAFHIRYVLTTDGIDPEDVKKGVRRCDLKIFLVQLSENLTLTNEFKNFCIHSNIIDNIKENGNHDTAFLDTLVIDVSACETASLGYLCHHWLYTEYQKGRILPPPSLKELIVSLYGKE